MSKTKYLPFLILLVISSCGLPSRLVPTATPITPEIPTPTETQIVSGVPTIEPTLEAMQLAIYPPERRIGDPELDAIIDAVLRHEFPVLKALTTFTRIGCTLSDGLGGPPKCEQGETEGTIVEVVPFLGPEGYHVRQTDYENWEGPDVLGLLAAYSTSDGTYQDPAYPAGDYALVFLLPRGLETITIQVADGRIIRYDNNIGGLTSSDLQLKAEEILLPLSFNPAPTRVPWNQFQDSDGRFSFVYPPTMELVPADQENSWHLANRIRIEVLPYDRSWITCFYQSVGDCPFVELDQSQEINGQDVRRIKGYIGAVGGNTPQEFLTYIFDLGDQALVMTVYALPFGTQVSDPGMVWPLEGMELELFERTVSTVTLD